MTRLLFFASAPTGLEAGVTSAPPSPVLFKVDRPFFCALRDDKTGATLFMGSILEPR